MGPVLYHYYAGSQARLVAGSYQLSRNGDPSRIIDGSRSKNGNLGLAFVGIRHRIVGSCREKHLNIG